MFSIQARSSSVAPRLAAKARKSQRSLTPSPPWIWPPMSLRRAGLGEQLDVGARGAREVARPRDADALGHDVGDAHRGGQRLADREAADRVVAARPSPTGSTPGRRRGPRRRCWRRRAALRVGVRAGQAADREHGQAVRDLDHVARRPDAGHRACACGRRRSRPPVVPASSPAAAASAVFGTLCRHTITTSQGELALRGRDRPHVVVAHEALDLGAEAQRHAALLERLVHGLGDVGVEHLARAPTGPRRRSRPAGRGGRGCRPSRRRAAWRRRRRRASPSSSSLSNSIALRMFLT